MIGLIFQKLFYKDSTLQSFIISEGHAYMQMIIVDWCAIYTQTHTCTVAIPQQDWCFFPNFCVKAQWRGSWYWNEKLAVITAYTLFLFLPSHINWSGTFLNPNIYKTAYEYFGSFPHFLYFFFLTLIVNLFREWNNLLK